MKELDSIIAAFGAFILGAYLIYIYEFKGAPVKVTTPTVNGTGGWGGPIGMTYNVRPVGSNQPSTLFPLTMYPPGIMS